MSDTFLTLADLAKINDQNVRDLDMSDLFDEAPLVKALYATTASNGTVHKYLKQTGAPTVGFRAIGAGRDNSTSTDTTVTATLTYLDADCAVDVAYAKGYVGGPQAAIAREVKRHLKAAFYAFESQIINGNDAAGFDGLVDALHSISDDMVISATGTTANTGSSVYLLRSVPDETGVAAVIGNNGTIDVSESTVIQKTGSNSKAFAAYLTVAGAWLGLQVGGAYSAARIANITDDSGKKLTDTLIYEAMSLFPASKQPTHIVMNRRSLKQLRDSRTATNATGAPAPRPTEVDGLPIIVTDAISSTEGLLSS